MTRDYSVLFVTVADEIHASSRVRVFQCVPHFERAGVRCRVLNLWPTKALGLSRYVPARVKATARYPFRLAEVLWAAGHHDLTYINLALLPVRYQQALRARARGLVFDFVDPIYRSSQTPGRQDGRRQQRFDHMLQIADAVITGNEPGRLLASSRNGLVLNVVGPIDTERFRPAPARAGKADVVLGWIGSSATTRYLREIAAPLRDVLGTHPQAQLELIGAHEPPLDGIAYKNHVWRQADEVAHLQRFDVGVMPLPDDPWTQGKGGYKLLQYMALGIPCVASPVGINREIVRDGVNGFLASTEGEWVAKLSLLVRDAQLRRRLGEQGRRDAEAEYALTRNVPRLLDVFEQVLHKGARRSPVRANAASFI